MKSRNNYGEDNHDVLPKINCYDEGSEQSSPTLYDIELAIKGLSESILGTINSRRI